MANQLPNGGRWAMMYRIDPLYPSEIRYHSPLSAESVADVLPFSGLSERQNFFEVLRRIERDRAMPVRLGDVNQRAYLHLQIMQPADMSFASREVVTISRTQQEHKPTKLRITCRHFGLFAPYGPLPIHITEHARQELLVQRSGAFEEFINILSQRLALFHYRAWAQLHVALGHEKPQWNSFLLRLKQLSGLSENLVVDPHVQRVRSRFSAAYLPGRRGLKTLCHILKHYFAVPVSLTPRHASWIDDAQGEVHQRLGYLGKTRVGKRFYDIQHKVKLVIGPLSSPDYMAFQRGSERLNALIAISQDYVEHQLLFEIDLIIETTPEMSGLLGKARLSKDGWLKATRGYFRKNLY